MRYLGGKGRIAKEIAPIINALRTEDRPRFWEPFCGGLNMSVYLAAHGPGILSDVNAPLLALYEAVRGGWEPPEGLTEHDWQEAKLLPDTDPLKAFLGIGCSYGGAWFNSVGRKDGSMAPIAATAWRSLQKDIAAIEGCELRCQSFFEVEPAPSDFVIYCDPPYAETTGYTKAGAFPSLLFWRRVQQWEEAGVPVLVTEYTCPVNHEVLWTRTSRSSMGARKRGPWLDRLFRVVI